MCSNLTTQKTQLTSDLSTLQSQLSDGKISLEEYNQKKADVDKQISDCDAKLADKQQNDMSELGDNLRREKYLRKQQSSDVAGLLSLFEKPDTTKLVREVAIALMGGHYVSIPCAGGGSVSSETVFDAT